MRKGYILIAVVASLLLTGCFGPAGYHFDDSPTMLDITLKRTPNGDTIPTNAKVRIWKTNPEGQIVYSLHRNVTIDPDSQIAKLAVEVPAKSAYRVAAMHASQGVFEIGERMINAPREQMTAVTISLTPIDVTINAPDKVYSGGSLGQFAVALPEEYSHLLEYGIMIGSTPWTENGKGDTLHLDLDEAYLSEVTEAQTLYYQMVVVAKKGTFTGERPTAYFPDLNEQALPHITIYP
jgi:hypothetical protein